MQDYIGKQIDRYRVTERLGLGGMAVVYTAYDTRLERDVALKLIRMGSIPPDQYERLMKRFEREAKSQARFSHPNIISVYDYGEVDGSPYLVMAYVPGETLKVRTGQPVNWEQALSWLIPIADALQYAHERNTIHRDIKPSNILFDERDQPILTDFGIAKLLETDETTLTGTGLGVGTPEYMAPEQWRGLAFPATDQYALGVVLYELLTGQKPYTADTPVAVALLQMSEPLRSPRSLVPSIPEPVEKLLYKALVLDPQDRYEDMTAFRAALEKQLIKKPVEAAEQVEKVQTPSEFMAPPRYTPGPEAETVDSLEQTPAEGMPVPDVVAPGQGAEKTVRKIKLPVWLLRAGAAVMAFLLLVGGITLLARAISSGGSTADVEPTQESIGLVDTPTPVNTYTPEPMATETQSPSPTYTETSIPTYTPTVTATPLPEGYFLMPDFKELGIEETIKFLEENNLNYQLAILVENKARGIISQKPEPGDLTSDSFKLDLEVSAVLLDNLSSVWFWYLKNEREIVTKSYSLNVNEGEIIYVKPYVDTCWVYDYPESYYDNDGSLKVRYDTKQMPNCSTTYSVDGNFNKNSIYVVSESKSINIRYSCNNPNWSYERICAIMLPIFKIN